MTASDLLLHRLHAQHLLSPGLDPAADLCGLQAQFLRNAVHALRIRSHGVYVDDLVKTWTLRGTVHLVPERDLPLYIRHCGGAEDVCRSGWYGWTASRGHANPPAREIELGDFIQLADEEGDYYHTLIITGFEPNDILICAHTDDALNRRLSTYNYTSLRFIHIDGVRIEVPDDICFEPLLEGRAIEVNDPTGGEEPPTPQPPTEGSTPPDVL